MVNTKYFVIAIIAGSFTLNACHSDKGNESTPSSLNAQDTIASSAKTVSLVIKSIPFPINLLDTLHDISGHFNQDLLNPAGNVHLYSESNAQSANLGVYGADLAYVISFEQFQAVGVYIKASKSLADNIGIPLAFAAQVIERCEKNQNNKDSLTAIVVQSYSNIDQVLKQNERMASEVLVLTGGWIEGVYLTSLSIENMPEGADKQKMFRILLEQKQYGDRLLSLLTQVSAASPYCFNLITPMTQIGTIYNGITSPSSFTDEKLKDLSEKIKVLRSIIIKGNS